MVTTTRSKFASQHGATLEQQSYEKSKGLIKSGSIRSLDNYEYSDLRDGTKDIRLITLLPGGDDEPIAIQIKHARLPEYVEQLSSGKQALKEIQKTLPAGWVAYETWEGPYIYVNEDLDASSWSHPVSRELDVARTSTQDVPGTPYFEALSTLWIDAICINQEDMAERNAQVQRMPHLYRLAYRVVVWLGPGSRQSKLAISTLRFLAEQVQVTRENHLVGMPGAVEGGWYHNNHDLPYDGETWRAILRFFQRLWFTRVWVVQEVNLANARAVVQCGEDEVMWVAFRRAALCLSTKYHLPSKEFRGEVASIAGLATYDRAAAYSQLTMSIYNRDCSNQRDRVYGLLGLMSEGLRKRVPADYSLSVEDVYKSSTLAQIEHFGRLDALRGCIDTGYGRAIDAPSWVPDLILPPPTIESIRQQFSAAMSRCIARYTEPDTLEVSGPESSEAIGDGLEIVRGWNLEHLERPYPGGGSMLDALAMTLCAMRVDKRYCLLKVEERHSWLLRLPTLEEWGDYLQKYVLQSDGPIEEEGPVSALFLSSVESVLFQRKLFSTAGGYIGLGPQGMEPGKCAVFGHDAPMILRRGPDGTYQVVGEGLIFGFHDGVCLLGRLPQPWGVQIFLNTTGDASIYRYHNSKTGQLVDDDPRLPPLQGWRRLDVDRTADDPEISQHFENLSTGEIVNHDPRMSLKALERRGAALKTFRLV
ncbi:heterokaryon incompatibility protein-domain-containing protein [Lasiosphaeris hirsuta]|uniref:Heterokaryon incompatibility protein-domain-containing protein n=1 Tax=Lasiosphaeris hirsuta TaxID=260670 RepID=A0AA40AZ04_9PEZI|nr:heterokaryon incompatibility protein-domain-containing protein [Lasiosphaeris hirsuta]